MSQRRMGAEPTGQLQGRSSSGDEVRAGGSGNGDGRSPNRRTAPDGQGGSAGLASDHGEDRRNLAERLNDPGSGDTTGTRDRNVGTTDPESSEHRNESDVTADPESVEHQQGSGENNDGTNGRGTPLARRIDDTPHSYESAVEANEWKLSSPSATTRERQEVDPVAPSLRPSATTRERQEVDPVAPSLPSRETWPVGPAKGTTQGSQYRNSVARQESEMDGSPCAAGTNRVARQESGIDGPSCAAGTAPRTWIDNVAGAVVGDDRNDSRRGLGVDEPVRSEGHVSLDPSSNADDDGDIERSFEIAEEALDRCLDEFWTEYPALCESKVVEELQTSDVDISSLEDPSEDEPTPVQRVDPSEGDAPDPPRIYDSSE
ncbi:hypothetical protein THAOC_30743 [Thalassiosira oceanica]|uniref:Uncharacterized protein n=1 Tax=Thalassiosira oceanica TaxID=159749 RepID=K0RAS3_THAOC|nr:hypothetical protein THAOC_30743 [Thalassiosira oceanica]|eukprot:EJK50310.1 hypothetical protein THAOC_30743 [Thalassiosira oceanica]